MFLKSAGRIIQHARHRGSPRTLRTTAACRTSISDSYLALGIAQSASFEEIKDAYHQSALQHHPDHGGDSLAFRKVYDAYKTLLDSVPLGSLEAFSSRAYDCGDPNVKITRISDHWDSGTPQLLGFEAPPGSDRRVAIVLRDEAFESWILEDDYPLDSLSPKFLLEVEVPERLVPGRYFVQIHDVESETRFSYKALASVEVLVDMKHDSDQLESTEHDSSSMASASDDSEVQITRISDRWEMGSLQLLGFKAPPGDHKIAIVLRNEALQTWIIEDDYPLESLSPNFLLEVEVPQRLVPGRYFVQIHEVEFDTIKDGALASIQVLVDEG